MKWLDKRRAKYLVVTTFFWTWMWAIWKTGWVRDVIENDSSNLSVAIFFVFIYYWVKSFIKKPASPTTFGAELCVSLGLIGTVIGFIVAMSGVSIDTIGNVEELSQTVSTLVKGMGIALYTTLTGATLGLWLSVFRRL